MILIGVSVGLLGGFAVMIPLSISVFIKPIAASFGWTRAQASLLSTMSFTGFTVAVPLLSMLVERFSLRSIMLTGFASLAFCLMLLGSLPGNIYLFSGVAFLSGLLTAITSPAGFMMVIARSFDRRLGTAIGLAMIGFGIGAVGMPIVAQQIMASVGWRAAFFALAAITLILGSISTAMIFKVLGHGAPKAVSDAAQEGAPSVTVLGVMSSWRFWVVGLAMLGTALPGFGAVTHIPAALSDRGMSAAEAAGAAGLVGAGLFLGRILAATLMDRIHAPVVAMGFFILGGLGLQVVLRAPLDSNLILLCGVFLSGLIVGSESDMGPVLTRRYFEPAAFDRIFGMLFFLGGLGGIFGPLLFGYLYDRSGSYDLPLTVGTIMCVASGLALLSLGKYQYRARAAAVPAPLEG